jgi:hypothetical protein
MKLEENGNRYEEYTSYILPFTDNQSRIGGESTEVPFILQKSLNIVKVLLTIPKNNYFCRKISNLLQSNYFNVSVKFLISSTSEMKFLMQISYEVHKKIGWNV